MDQESRKRGWLRRRRAPILIALLVLAGLGVFAYRFENFHEILSEQQIYGSAQMSPSALEDRIERHGIRTVINLRGENEAHEWYRDEITVARKTGVVHHDFSFSSVVMPSRAEMQKLIEVLSTCPKPALIHCQSGIDRTGLAAVVCILSLDDNGSPEKALDHVSIWRGHLPWRDTVELKRAMITSYRGWLDGRDCEHNPAQFRRWVDEAYLGTYERQRAAAARGGD